MALDLEDVLTIMRRAIGRRNENDPDSNDDTLLFYINNFMSLKMSDDVKLFEVYDTLIFTIDETNTTGVYTFNDVGADHEFINISLNGFITLKDPPSGSISWQRLRIYQDPGIFYDYWGINNTDVLIPGYPTEMLYYGTEMVFRTIPNTSYTVKIFGYKRIPEYSSVQDEEVENQLNRFDYWLRYIAYGAALDYARDFRYSPEEVQQIQTIFQSERKTMVTRTHNQIKLGRCLPRF